MKTLISLKTLSFDFAPGQAVLKDINLALSATDRLALIGKNGSGKSTLLRLIMGFLEPTHGAIEVFGKERRKKADFQEVRGQVSILFQNSDDHLFCPSVEEELAFGPLNLKVEQEEVRKRINDALSAVKLQGFENRVPFELSGGEKRMVALASLLTMRPKVLLLDEPTAGLDHDARRIMLDILSKSDSAMIVVSHDDEVLDTLCNRRVYLKNGSLCDSE